MRAYFLLCLKAAGSALPRVLAVSLCLVLLIGAGWGLVAPGEEAQPQRLQIGLVGDLQGSYLQMGLFALEYMDTSRAYLKFVPMELADARQALQNGEISGYLHIPDGFVEGIVARQPVSARYVVADGPVGMGTLLTRELVAVARELVEESQRGIYGMQNLARDKGWAYKDKTNPLALRYTATILDRGQTLEVIPVGEGGVEDTALYWVCVGLTLLLLGWGVLGFSLFTLRSPGPGALLAARGLGAVRQYLLRTGALALVTAGLLPLWILCLLLATGQELGLLWGLWLGAAPLALSAAALHGLWGVAIGHPVTAALAAFCVALPGAFVSGCLIPLWYFPPTWQQVSACLPGGLWLQWLKGLAGAGVSLPQAGLLLAWTALSLGLGAWAYGRRLERE